MTPHPDLSPEDAREWSYIYAERLGISCGAGEPTKSEIEAAKEAADQAIGLEK